MDEGKDGPQIFHFSLLSGEREELDALISRAQSREDVARQERARKKVPGRFKGKLDVDPKVFDPMTDEEVKEFMGE